MPRPSPRSSFDLDLVAATVKSIRFEGCHESRFERRATVAAPSGRPGPRADIALSLAVTRLASAAKLVALAPTRISVVPSIVTSGRRSGVVTAPWSPSPRTSPTCRRRADAPPRLRNDVQADVGAAAAPVGRSSLEVIACWNTRDHHRHRTTTHPPVDRPRARDEQPFFTDRERAGDAHARRARVLDDHARGTGVMSAVASKPYSASSRVVSVRRVLEMIDLPRTCGRPA